MSLLGFVPFLFLMIVAMLAIGNGAKCVFGLYKGRFELKALLNALVLAIIFIIGFNLMAHFAIDLGIKVSEANA